MEKTNQQTKIRITWIDMLKGYCMLFVMLHHLSTDTFSFPSIYASFYAPFFLTAFFVSAGLTYSTEKRFDKYLLNKVLTLLVPLFLLGIITIFMTSVITFNEQANIGVQIIDLFTQVGTAGHRLWFIAAMFVYCIAFYPIAKICKDRSRLIAVIIFILLVCNIVLDQTVMTIQLPWHIETLGYGVFWIGGGYLIKQNKYKIHLFISTTKRKWITFSVIGMIYMGLIALSRLVFKSNYISFGSSAYPILSLLMNCFGVAFIMLLSKLTPQFKFIQYIGKNTLFYFAFHGKVQSLLFWLFGKIGIITLFANCTYISSICIVFVNALILVIPCMLFELILPFTVGKRYDKERFKKFFRCRK